VYNNTIYNNQPGEGVALQYYASAPIVRNNIIYANGTGIVDYGGTSAPTVSHNLTTDPRFVNSSAGDFTLQSSSTARDAGVTIPSVADDYSHIARPWGSGYDIGAHEYRGTQAAPSVPTGIMLVYPTK
jgi:hypothetical protein